MLLWQKHRLGHFADALAISARHALTSAKRASRLNSKFEYMRAYAISAREMPYYHAIVLKSKRHHRKTGEAATPTLKFRRLYTRFIIKSMISPCYAHITPPRFDR